jgi:hypothetical protein
LAGEKLMAFAFVLVLVVELYAVTGIAVAVVFLTIGIGRVDKAARHAYVFRLLLIPGVVLLWPLVLTRWLTLSRRASGEPWKTHAT